VDLVDNLGRDVLFTTVIEERLLEPAITPELADRRTFPFGGVDDRAPPTLSDTLAATTTTAMSRPTVSTIPNVFRPEIFFPLS
jgi:hypothetical protein